LLQEEKSELQSQLDVLQKQLENSEGEKKKYISKYREVKDKKEHDVAIQTDEENSELQSQLDVLQKQLENSEVEKRKYINKYRELKDKKRHDAAIQTDEVCSKNR